MAVNTYDVGDKVELIIEHKCEKHGEEIVYKDHYAGIIITYRSITDRKTGEDQVIYKVSVDGIGKIIYAREKDDGELEVINDYNESEIM